MIEKFSLSTFPFDFTKDFVIVGDRPSAGWWKFDPEKVSIFYINRSISWMRISDPVIITLFMHEEFMVDYLKAEKIQDAKLIIITLEDIRRFHLSCGDTFDIFLIYLVIRMRAEDIRGKMIWLPGVEFADTESEFRNWFKQVENVNSAKVQADYIDCKIYLCQTNRRLEFLKVIAPPSSILSHDFPKT